MVLFGTYARLQQDCGHALQNLPRTAALRLNHDLPVDECTRDFTSTETVPASYPGGVAGQTSYSRASLL